MYLNKSINTSESYVLFPFYKNDSILENAPVCGMSLKKAGSMRFRWAETNDNRKAFFDCLTKNENNNCVCPMPVELIHSQIVYDFKNENDNYQKTGDGIITTNKKLMPTITVADCVPIYFYDEKTGVFGIVHSGWKGTGIIKNALELAEKNYNAHAEDFSVIIGPHIHSCCYIVNQERAEYFASNFTERCVEPLEENGTCYCGGKGLPITWNNGSGKLYRLSLEEANLAVLKKIGVKEKNISLYTDCTCCNEIFGSNRRQTAYGQEFCVQAAFIFNNQDF